VWFVQEDEKLYLLPVGGAGSDWYRNVLKTPTIRVGGSGIEVSAQATPITDPATVNDIVNKFRASTARTSTGTTRSAMSPSRYPSLERAVRVISSRSPRGRVNGRR
jgi:hypothetical protein